MSLKDCDITFIFKDICYSIDKSYLVNGITLYFQIHLGVGTITQLTAFEPPSRNPLLSGPLSHHLSTFAGCPGGGTVVSKQWLPWGLEMELGKMGGIQRERLKRKQREKACLMNLAEK